MSAIAALKEERLSLAADELIAKALATIPVIERLYARAEKNVSDRVSRDNKLSSELLEREQHITHGLAWLATTIQAMRECLNSASRLMEENKFGPIEKLITQIGFGEYLAQVFHGIAMSQGEIIRLSDFGISARTLLQAMEGPVEAMLAIGNIPENRLALAHYLNSDHGSTIGDAGLDETLEAIRSEISKFAESEVAPYAHDWHLKNAYIPLEVVKGLADMGVFGLTLPEEYGGMGLGKVAMCVVTEELTRAYIGVGSLGTRSEIASELILGGGTAAQKEKYLPLIASGEILPTAVFTEPNTGSDLASLRTRAVQDGDVYKISGNKTWITHPVRADLMTILARTNPNEPGYRGLSMFLAEKPRGDDATPFPVKGLTGGEIEVLGYRGMKEYELAFDQFEVKAEKLLGELEGQGFKQLMQTFESARIQTAARAVGLAQCAIDLARRYANERIQFGKPLLAFPRVSDKIVMMIAETHMARQLTYFSARSKDEGRRCDLEAGMAKLLGARVAWSAADNALQIHGGNGFALEYPISRVLCDARILNIFEGAAEIQAQVIARRLLEGAN